MLEKSLDNVVVDKIDNITNKDNKALKEDLIFFKEELLKEMNILEKSFSQQKEEIRAKINGKFILYDETIEKLNINFSELKKIVDMNKYLKEQVDNWSYFKKDISDKSSSNEIKLTLLEKEVTNNFYRIDKILNNSIIYPRIIGKNARFKTFHEFIDYTLEQLLFFDSFRSKMELDLKSFKIKVEKIIQSLKIKLECSINDCRQIVKNGIKENEIIIKDYITGKIYDLQVKDNEIEKKIEDKAEQFNLGLNDINEKIQLINEEMEEKMSQNKFNEEKETINYEFDQCKNKDEELNTRINTLEKYKENQEKRSFWMMKTFRKRKKGDYNKDLGLDYMNDNKENIKNNELNLNTSNINDNLDNKNKENPNNSVNDELNNNNGIKLNKVMLDQNLVVSDNLNDINNKIRTSQRQNKTMRSLNKLRISLNDINAQFNLGNLKENLNNKSNKDTYTQNFPMTTPIHTKYINFNELLSFSFKNQLKNFLEPKTLRSPISIKNKEIKFFYDDINAKNLKNNDIINDGPSYKTKNHSREEKKKTWERLLSPKKKVKSNYNILDTYFVNFRNLRKNKTMNRMHLSRSSKNFFSNHFKNSNT